MYKKGIFERYIDAMEKTGDIMLRYYFQKQMIKESLLSGEERQKLIDDVAEQVLSRISASVDASEVFDAIDEIKDRLNNLLT